MRIYRFIVIAPNKLVLVVICLDYYYHFVGVPICAYVIQLAYKFHRYWDIYENIS